MESNLFLSYKLTCGFYRFVFKFLYRGKVYGSENFKNIHGCIIACNHVSFLDPPFIASVSPIKPLYSFARKTLFKKGLMWFLKNLYMIGVNRDSGNDISAIKQTINLLNSGESVLMFPEGTRSVNGEIQKAKKGIGLFVEKTKASVIPTRIFGSFEALPKGKKFPSFKKNISIVFGKPLTFDNLSKSCKNDCNRLQQISDKIMYEISKITVPFKK